jgi:hypothetical protein
MEITREGTNRRTGATSLVQEVNRKTVVEVNWSSWNNRQVILFNEATKQIEINAYNVSNSDKSGNYDFSVSLTLDDIAEILKQLANDGLKEAPSEIHAALKASRTSLLRLLACAEGYTSSKIPRQPKTKEL